ncbi:mitogen-activated protein kinase kinase kinase 7-like isoform X2 [Babylonia areolata]|uniref:mitogen-activated protein kinase kinase kinase 7-like isoform X2 n=1 Tax=Babylonia areolata TaxID=304850 RepID=UPI003FD4B196
MESSTFIEEIDYRELQFGEVVGKGAFGVVSRAKWRGKDVAVKRIETESEKKAFMQELKQLSRVNHPNIVCLYGACREQPVCLVMEYAEGGSLYNVLHGSGPQPYYTAAHAMNWLLQCARGVEYLHGMKPKALIHRDLKPPNLLLIQCGTKLKICDFGTACDIQTHMTNNKGSAAWMAPEVFEGCNYSEKCDVFSWGIILWEVLTRRKPFDEIGGPAFRIMWAVHNGTRPPLIQGLPKTLELLMTKCWSGNPAERPSMSEVVRIMSHIFQFFHGADQPLTLHRVDSDEDLSPSHAPRTNVTTPTHSAHLASPPIGESRTATIRNTVRYNQETSTVDSVFTNSPPPVARHPPVSRGTPPVVVEEKRRGQMSAPPSLAASRESLHEPRSRSMTPVDSSKRYSADLTELDENDFGSSQAAISGQRANFSTPSLSIVAQETRTPQPHSMHHCPTYPGELSQAAGPGLNPPTSPPLRSFSHQPQATGQKEGVMMYPRSLSTPDGRPLLRKSNPIIQQGYSDADACVSEALNDDFYFALEPHLQPLAPHPTNPESMRIFAQHCQLAEEYMRIQAEIAVLSRRKQELSHEHEQQTPQQSTTLVDIEEYTRLSAENESLLKYHADLRTQVEAYRRNAKRFPASRPAHVKN